VVQTTVVVSILLICFGAVAYVHFRPRTAGRPDDLGGAPATVIAPAPAPAPQSLVVPPPAPAPVIVRPEAARTVPQERPAEVVRTRVAPPAPVAAAPAVRRGRANSGFNRFAGAPAQARVSASRSRSA
jgi:hypothetical protein